MMMILAIQIIITGIYASANEEYVTRRLYLSGNAKHFLYLYKYLRIKNASLGIMKDSRNINNTTNEAVLRVQYLGATIGSAVIKALSTEMATMLYAEKAMNIIGRCSIRRHPSRLSIVCLLYTSPSPRD